MGKKKSKQKTNGQSPANGVVKNGDSKQANALEYNGVKIEEIGLVRNPIIGLTTLVRILINLV